MISIDEISQYLPKYLSPESENRLFHDLSQFPDNINNRMYTTKLKDEPTIFQGDGLNGLLLIFLPEPQARAGRAMVLSNSCDIGPQKDKALNRNIVYSPIVDYTKYIEVIRTLKTPESLKSYEEDIRRQGISSIFFLPKGNSLENDSLIFFDRIISCNLSHFNHNELIGNRVFTLSDYGLYLFLFKMSIHFTRIREGVDRG